MSKESRFSTGKSLTGSPVRRFAKSDRVAFMKNDPLMTTESRAVLLRSINKTLWSRSDKRFDEFFNTQKVRKTTTNDDVNIYKVKVSNKSVLRINEHCIA
jgi:hypothetical protein